MRPLAPTITAHLYAGLHERLMELLRNLTPADWHRPSVCREWLVRDIAAHMLDTQTRILSFLRDGNPLPAGPPPDGYAGLVAMLNRLNAEWVRTVRRVSPPVLVDFLAVTGPQLAEYVMSLDPHAPAVFSVAWAGEEESANWFHIGRDYTEYWHHQQQIRDAVGAPLLTGREWLFPALEVFVRALPHTYHGVPCVAGQNVNVIIHGEPVGKWAIGGTGRGNCSKAGLRVRRQS